MKINVVQSEERFICGVKYQCTHRETDIEIQYNGYYSHEDESYIEHESKVEVCLNPDCEAWRELEDVLWQDDYMVEVDR